MDNTNNAALREACKAALDALTCGDIGVLGDHPAEWELEAERKLKAQLDAALSAPPRNCDAGTAEEQWKRYRRFCYGKSCYDCPLRAPQCELAWAQMPYEAAPAQEGGDDGN